MRLRSLARSPAWLVLALAALTAYGAGCAAPQTQLENMWRDPRYTEAPIHSAFVLAIRRDPIHRRLWEDSYVEQLAKHGVQATPSYTVYADDLPDTDAVRDYVEEKGYDATIFSVGEGTEKVQEYVSGYATTEPVTYFHPMWGTYVTSYREVYHQGYVETNTAVRVRTDVWRRTGKYEGKLVWSGTSSTVDPTSTNDFSHDVAELATHELAKYHFIP
jgi:hypothetical protein